MREHMGLFRGKRIVNGEWVQGCLVTPTSEFLQYKAFIAESLYCGQVCDTDRRELMLGGFTEVDPDTVGECTGLTDKNGKLVFEGDVLRIAKMSDGLGNYYCPAIDYPVNVVVKWDMCAWMWETLCEDKYYITFPNAWCHYECEIIGNIHDNPELLKGGEADEAKGE